MREFLADLRTLTEDDIEAKYPNQCFYHWNKIKVYQTLKQKKIQTWDGELRHKNFWVWSPGTGKSKWAHSVCTPEQFCDKEVNKWWGGYVAGVTKVVSIEDFPGDGAYLGYYLKKWADRYCFEGETKGGHELICPGTFFLVITSNYSPEQIFKQEDLEPILRRFDVVHVESSEDIFLSTVPVFSILY